MAGQQHHAADAGRGRGAARLADALDRATGLFGAARHAPRARRRRAARGSTRSRSGKFFASSAGSASPAYLILGRDARHRHRALGQRGDAVAAHVVGRDHRLLAPDQHAKTHVVALGALRFLDRAVAHVDRLRHRAHRHRVGGIGAGRAGSLDRAARRARSGRIGRTGNPLRAFWFRRRAQTLTRHQIVRKPAGFEGVSEICTICGNATSIMRRERRAATRD